ncbi:DUF493 family protein [Fulvivirgaceae bacterium BMA10]|uniref:DUF493 family protein n=1 Tax=Splendidivirga corallicola TaxID=3051826 RepID=A0ABT8KWB9_9BACT|nr:DUF493 family protein [Fulvivirgaceae bacterium BMA10]
MSSTTYDDSFREKLDNEHDWPDVYMFKFIVPRSQEQSIRDLFPSDKVEVKESSSGKYVSVTATKLMRSSQEVIDIYVAAHKVEGVIAL